MKFSPFRTCIPNRIASKMSLTQSLILRDASPIDSLRYSSQTFSKDVLDQVFKETGLSRGEIVQFCLDLGTRALIPPGPMSIKGERIRKAFEMAVELQTQKPDDAMQCLLDRQYVDPDERPLTEDEKKICDSVDFMFSWPF